MAAFLAYRRAGGENHNYGAKLVALVGQAVTSGETAQGAELLAQLGSNPDQTERGKALVPVLQRILAGERDGALAKAAGLYYMDEVEVGLLLESLRRRESTREPTQG